VVLHAGGGPPADGLPVALSAYFLAGVVPDWALKDIYSGMMQFMVLQIVGLLLVLAFPQLALLLPQLMRN
jgi:TRAP-type mannitol/chloroaromatic compound transport system permease large subunit